MTITPLGADTAPAACGPIYLSGPMSGLPDLNFPAFHQAAAALRGLGFEVVNPAEINPDSTLSWSDCMRADVRALCDCATLALLPGWARSSGAHVELNLAHRLGLHIVTLEDLLAQCAAQASAAAAAVGNTVNSPASGPNSAPGDVCGAAEGVGQGAAAAQPQTADSAAPARRLLTRETIFSVYTAATGRRVPEHSTAADELVRLARGIEAHCLAGEVRHG